MADPSSTGFPSASVSDRAMPPPPAPLLQRTPVPSATGTSTTAATTAAPWAPPAIATQRNAPIGLGVMPRGGGGFGAGTPASSAAAAQAAQAIRAEPAFPPVVALVSLPDVAAPATKRIVNEDDLRTFLDGTTVRSFIGFLLALNSSVLGRKLSQAAAPAVPPAATAVPPAATAVPPSEATGEAGLPTTATGLPVESASSTPGAPSPSADAAAATRLDEANRRTASLGTCGASPELPPSSSSPDATPLDTDRPTKPPLQAQLQPAGGDASSSSPRAADPSPAIRSGSSPDVEPSPTVDALCAALNEMSGWIDDFPPVTTELRFGNPSFRQWAARLVERAEGIIQGVLPEDLKGMATEMAPMLADSFGNASRIDYGTGHETLFAAFLYCLARLGVVKEVDAAPLVARVFAQYLALVRRLQTTYWLEPAGSHGVWGLDDYQFLPFLWGSAQLVGHPMIRPKSIHNPDVLEGYSHEYMYLACIDFVKKVKKGALGETSPMLNDISGVPNWDKVNRGMLKMYLVEVLSKFPIMQHFLFGSLMPLE